MRDYTVLTIVNIIFTSLLLGDFWRVSSSWSDKSWSENSCDRSAENSSSRLAEVQQVLQHICFIGFFTIESWFIFISFWKRLAEFQPRLLPQSLSIFCVLNLPHIKRSFSVVCMTIRNQDCYPKIKSKLNHISIMVCIHKVV